jgi:NAD(P)-dependent dehydrogenase (short-subunit alcohol dehydrogenase family)
VNGDRRERRVEELTGRIAVVTGAARGIGRATALRLARSGADVALIDIDLAGAAKFDELLTAPTVRDEIVALGRRATAVEADLTDESAVQAAFQAIEQALGPVEILVNVAGGAITPIDRSKPSELTVEDIHRNFDVNYLSAVLCARAVIPAMRAAGRGAIVNISSALAVVTDPDGRLQAYGAAKAAVSHLTRGQAAELGRYGIRANAVAPGLIATARIRAQAQSRALGTPDEAANVPLGRHGTAEDVASAVNFLVSDEASFITGQVLSVCGGAALVPS